MDLSPLGIALPTAIVLAAAPSVASQPRAAAQRQQQLLATLSLIVLRSRESRILRTTAVVR